MQEDWTELTLNDVCLRITDGAHHSPKSVEKGLPMASVKDLTQFGINLESCRQISEEDFEKLVHLGCQPEGGDVLIAKDGNSALDTVCEVKKKQDVVLLSSIAILRPNLKKITSSFLRYYLDSDITRQYLKNGFITGAAIPRVILKDFKRAKIKLPPADVQRKITAVLSAYDDLIENNTRRIAILEEMAQALYREWFVHFRFPGHEAAAFVEVEGYGRVPGGWEVRPLGDVCNSIKDGDWIETKDQGGEDYRLLQVSNVGLGEFVETGNFRFITQEAFERLRCQEILPGDILVSRMPRPTGRAWLVTEMPWRMVTAVDVAIVTADPEKSDPVFLTYLMNSQPHLDLVEKHQSGTTRPRISRRNLMTLKILVPPLNLQTKYKDFAGKNYELVTLLRNKITNLRQTRDLLLPRLISGELDVSRIQVPGTSEVPGT